ncbi:hypothetical protein MXB_1446, partial [Myxobolus squamalis]
DIHLENTEENRRCFREMLFSVPGAEECIGGIIFHEETFDQKDSTGKRFVDVLRSKGIKVGIKLDKGLVTIPGTKDEKTTQGLDDLAERCKKFAAGGAEFAKWRCVLKISEEDQTPSKVAYSDVARTLTKYALICQHNGIVPIVEPEVLRDGNHTLAHAQQVTEKILKKLYFEFSIFGVYLEGTLLKPNMVTCGQDCTKKYTPEEVAIATVTALARTVPCSVPGVTFLSGGQSERDASIHLNAINQVKGTCPWALTFSFARALQNSAVLAWGGKKENISAAHEILNSRIRYNGLASLGKYDDSKDCGKYVKGSLFLAGHTY